MTWNDFEDEPFYTADHPPMSGPAPNGYYYWTANLPANKSGRHIIYSVWQRSDSQETFYGCSDVVFDGGNGEVTGIRNNPGPNPTPTPTPTGSPTPTPTPTGSTACTATFAKPGEWPDGFQGEVTVRNTGPGTLNGWTVQMTFANGQPVTQSWNGTHSQSGAVVTVRNAAWNGVLGPDATVNFGFLGT